MENIVNVNANQHRLNGPLSRKEMDARVADFEKKVFPIPAERRIGFENLLQLQELSMIIEEEHGVDVSEKLELLFPELSAPSPVK